MELIRNAVEKASRYLAKHPEAATATDAAATAVRELLGVPRSWVYEQSRRGQIPTVSLGRYRRYRREAIEVWIEEIEGMASRGVGPRR